MSKVPDIKTGWWAFELPQYRSHPQPTTYSLFSYEGLPPVQAALDDDFEWLQSEPIKSDSMAESGYSDGSQPDLGKLPAIVSTLDVQLPASFLSFMSSPDLHRRLRSCTDCYFDVADRAVRTTTGYLIHFLSDSQWCLHWYVHVNNSGDHFIAASPNSYGFALDEVGTDADVPHRQEVLNLEHEEICYCAPTFTEFIYRFWLENEIWYALAWEKRPLTKSQQAYVNWYRSPGKKVS